MATFMKSDGVYLPANSVALTKNKLLTDEVTMYSGGNDEDGYWVKLSNGNAFFMKSATVTFSSSYNSLNDSFYRWVCDGSTNTEIRDTFLPSGVKFIQPPGVWIFARDGWTSSAHTESTSINVNGFSTESDSTYGYKLSSFTLNVNDPTLYDVTLTCVMIGKWKTSTTTDSSHRFIAPSNSVKWSSNSIAFSNGSTPITLKNMIANNSIKSSTVGSGSSSGTIEFKDGLKIFWGSVTNSSFSSPTSGAKGYIKQYNLSSFSFNGVSFSFPPAVFISSTSADHIPMSTFGTTATSLGTVTFSGANSTTGTTIYILAIGI